MGLMQRLFGPKKFDDTEVRTIADWDSMPTTPREEAHARTVLIDSSDFGPEVAEIKPIGVAPHVPKNKQELVEELRKNYADVIELVRKVNTHLDDQGARLAEQESRGRELIEIARQIPALLATLPRLAEQNTALLGLVERLASESASGNESIRAAVVEHTRATAESGAALASAIESTGSGLSASVRESAESSRRTAEAMNTSINTAITDSTTALSDHLGAVRSATETTAHNFEAARAQLQAQSEQLHAAMAQHRKWNIIAAVIGVIAIVATAIVAAVLLTQK